MKFNSGNMKYSLIIAYNMYPYMPVKIFTLYFSEFFLMLFRDWCALRLKDLVRVPHGLRNSLDQSRCGIWGWGDRMCSLNCMSPSDPPATLWTFWMLWPSPTHPHVHWVQHTTSVATRPNHSFLKELIMWLKEDSDLGQTVLQVKV